jgi:hypothetical protein
MNAKLLGGITSTRLLTGQTSTRLRHFSHEGNRPPQRSLPFSIEIVDMIR